MTNLIYSALPNPRRDIVYIEPQCSALDCMQLMVKENIGAVLVREADNLIGIIAERDLIYSCLSQGVDPKTMIAKDIAYKEFSKLDINNSVELAMKTMTKTKRRHVLIFDKGELVAILSIGDLLFYLLHAKKQIIKQLKKYIQS